jgi:hypothetical protein
MHIPDLPRSWPKPLLSLHPSFCSILYPISFLSSHFTGVVKHKDLQYQCYLLLENPSWNRCPRSSPRKRQWGGVWEQAPWLPANSEDSIPGHPWWQVQLRQPLSQGMSPVGETLAAAEELAWHAGGGSTVTGAIYLKCVLVQARVILQQ